MIHAPRSRSALAVIAVVVLASGLVRGQANPAPGKPAPGKPDNGSVQIEYRGKLGDLYYYVIENDITDDVAIHTQQFRLPSSTTFKDKRTVIQSIVPPPAPATQPVPKHQPPPPPPAKNDALLYFEWTVERYEASEVVTDMSEIAFDSLKHTHPPRELSGLAKVPGAKATFGIDGKTGVVSAIKVQPGSGAHPTDNRQSKTAENGLVTTENMQELLYGMGEQFLPNAPKRVGDQWVIKREKQQQPFGTVTTNTTCKFKSLDKVGDAEIATIDLTGVIFFVANPVKPPPAPHVQPPIVTPTPTTRPTTSAPRYPIAPRPTKPYNPTTRTAPQDPPRPATRPTSRSAARFQTPPGAKKPADLQKPSPPSPSDRLKVNPSPSLNFSIEPQPEAHPPATKKADEPSSPVIPIVQSQPVEQATSQPVTLPVTTQPAKPTEEPFQMEGAHFSGSLKFDVTNGRLVELILRSNSAFFKVMRSDKEEMKIKQGTKHILRIKGSVTPPPQPNIPGGKKPPVEKALPNARPVTTKPTANPQIAAQTTQPSIAGIARPLGNTTTQPAANRGATTQAAANPASALSKSRPIPLPKTTSQPRAVTPTTQPAAARD